MKAIFGLGNPGRQYKKNRHNVGYMIVDELAGAEGVVFKRSFKLAASLARKNIGKEKVFFVKPRTFMNNSGRCVKKVLEKYKLHIQDCLIVYDDVDLPLGVIRFRQKGSCAGHRGMTSIVSVLGTNEINRLRVGISNPKTGDLSNYVLSNFSSSEQEILHESISGAESVCLDWIEQGTDLTVRRIKSG